MMLMKVPVVICEGGRRKAVAPLKESTAFSFHFGHPRNSWGDLGLWVFLCERKQSQSKTLPSFFESVVFLLRKEFREVISSEIKVCFIWRC